MSLRLGDKPFPDTQVSLCPLIWAKVEDVVWQDIIVSKGWYNGDDKVVGGVIIVLVIWFAKCVDEFLNHVLIQANNLIDASWILLIVVMASRIASPDDKVNRVSQFCFYPIKGRVD